MWAGVEVQAERVRLWIELRKQPGYPPGKQSLLVFPNRTVRIVGCESCLWQDVQAGEESQCLVKTEVGDVTPPFLVDQLQSEQAQQRRGCRDHLRARVARLFDEFVESQLCQERPEYEDTRNTSVKWCFGFQERARSDIGYRWR